MAPHYLGCVQARTVHEASLEDVRKLEERRDAEATVLHQVERTETALRYSGRRSHCGERVKHKLTTGSNDKAGNVLEGISCY